jgi:hypothetical protein
MSKQLNTDSTVFYLGIQFSGLESLPRENHAPYEYNISPRGLARGGYFKFRPFALRQVQAVFSDVWLEWSPVTPKPISNYKVRYITSEGRV